MAAQCPNRTPDQVGAGVASADAPAILNTSIAKADFLSAAYHPPTSSVTSSDCRRLRLDVA